MDDDIQEGGDPAEAFDRLRAVIEGQDRELALLRRAVEGLAAERAAIDVPDYAETLGRIQQGVDTTADRIAVINDMIARSPALAITPEQMAQRIAAAGNAARREDQATLAKAGEDKARLMAELRDIAGSGLTRTDQNMRQLWFGLGGAVIGIFIWAVVPGIVAREVAPASWQWPERMAARTLRLDAWETSRRLAVVSQPEQWNAIIRGGLLVEKNRAAIEQCEKSAAKTRKAATCTIRIVPRSGGSA